MIHIEEDNLLEVVVRLYNSVGGEVGGEVAANDFGMNLNETEVIRFMNGFHDEATKYIIIKQGDPTL